ncbi:MAG: pyridoxal phosphate-dependent aminotransferase [Planctomycetes bacterium]|nr:pyridoxal phosphate-dependent aminotransferase [Planctomycetota bacterium]
MRRNIVHEGAGSLSYAIREMVEVAHKFQDLGQEIVWENIGDPVQKGEEVAPWIREILHDIIEQPGSWGYCPTAGIKATREFLAQEVNQRSGGVKVTADDIIFFNGIGDAVAKIYGFLRREARVIGPTPAYSTHSSAEAAHSGYEHLTYELDPYNNWMPDLADLRQKCHYNDSIAGILLINPDNPTGAVYPREVLEEMVAIARDYKLFIIADEIYAHIVYNGNTTLHLSEVIGDVCALVLRGISKEIPWPGARCGWIEVLNRDHDKMFNTYVNSLLASKMLEVCSTTMPQLAIPRIFSDQRYLDHLTERAKIFERNAREAVGILSGIPGVIVNPPSGAFYLTVMFEEGVLNSQQSLQIDNPAIREMLGGLLDKVPNDQRFVFYLLAAKGICVVPLSGFCCRRDGFRLTLLECNDERRRQTFETIAGSIKEYLGV